MRIISGSSRGKILFSPSDERVRPTSDRAKEGIFSTLESDFGDLTDARFLDLFAGSGAIAAEALSRGAGTVHAVEAEFAELTKKNLALVKEPNGSYQVFAQKVEHFLANQLAAPYDLIFLDPPYELVNEQVELLLNQIAEWALLSPSGIIAVERASESKRSPAFSWPSAFIGTKMRKYGLASVWYGTIA
jgi:16S rRNA (guanine966-N2)-methyltransferase